MDIQLEKKKGIQKKHIPYIAGGAVVILLLIWIIFGNHASTLRVDAASLNIADVTFGKFNDYIRLNGQVQPISVVQLSPEEGGIVQEVLRKQAGFTKKEISRKKRRCHSPSQQLKPGLTDSECRIGTCRKTELTA